MINGTTAKMTNILVAALVAIALLGVIAMGVSKNEVPAELSMMLTAGMGFLVGTRFTPLGEHYTEKKPSNVQPHDRVVVNEDKRE